jgi:hypothetical protein
VVHNFLPRSVTWFNERAFIFFLGVIITHLKINKEDEGVNSDLSDF